MKAYKKYISLFLSILFVLMSFNGAFANTNSDKVEPSTNVISKVEKLDESEVPVLLDYEEMVEKGHIERLYSEEQEMNSAVFKNEDGTNTLYIFNEDIKYVDSEGVTKDKSNKLTKTKTGYINLENDIRVLYPDNIDDGVTVTHGKYIITMTPVLDTTRKNKPVAKLNTQSKSHKIEYASTFDENIRIEYIQSLSGMKEAIILEKNCGVTQFDFSLKTNGLQVIANKQTLAFYDATNKEFVGEISPVVIWDANGKMGSGSYKLSTVKENEEYRITVVADDFLKNNDIKYPVTIDPSYNISGSNAIDDATIFSNNSQNVGNSGSLYIGNYSAWTQWTYYDGIGRTLVKFPGLDADALFRMICLERRIITMKYNFADMFSTAPSNTIQAYVASQSWNENTVVYNSTIWTPGNFVDSVSVSQMTSTPSPRRRYTIDFTDAYFSETGFSSKGLLLKASNENAVAMVICSNEYDSTYSTTGNAPYIEIAYHSSSGWMDGWKDLYHLQ
ncbi:MAG: hypothetical protein J6L23_06140 [Clostridia bacterium]|nr:hypothetical protein [Clostridia bacterium]